MKINVLPRSFFEKRKGTPEEREILATHRVISIQTSNGDDTEPPFSQDLLQSPNLLCLVFDDIVDNSGRQFSAEDAKAILDFVCDDSLPLMIHCTAGIARSGAVGEVLDWYYNCWMTKNEPDHLYFLRENPQVMPNSTVRRLLMRELYERAEQDHT